MFRKGGDNVKYLYLILLSVCLGFGSNALALDTHYNNKEGYKVVDGYNNKIPYAAFFKEHKPNPEVIKVQKTTKFGNVIQAEIPIHQTEQNVEQKGLED